MRSTPGWPRASAPSNAAWESSAVSTNQLHRYRVAWWGGPLVRPGRLVWPAEPKSVRLLDDTGRPTGASAADQGVRPRVRPTKGFTNLSSYFRDTTQGCYPPAAPRTAPPPRTAKLGTRIRLPGPRKRPPAPPGLQQGCLPPVPRGVRDAGAWHIWLRAAAGSVRTAAPAAPVTGAGRGTPAAGPWFSHEPHREHASICRYEQ